MNASVPFTVLCNGATVPGKKRSRPQNVLRLDYQGKDAKVRLKLPDFVRNVVHLPDRVLDLLEIAAYVFATDRSVSRGDKDALEFHAWSRSLRFIVKVRDHAFWKRKQVQQRLFDALTFMSGDRSYTFEFQPGHSTSATNLFDREGFVLTSTPGTKVALFSGGLDSLAGVVDTLGNSPAKMCLISHQSGQTGTIRTQNQLFAALDARYPQRLQHYKFKCGLQGERAEEETQRTRSFLYMSTAYSLAHALGTDSVTAFENGVTAINFPRRADLLNARASRTTHPKVVYLMQAFLSEVQDAPFRIETPYLWKTKADVVALLAERGAADLITSAVSCSKTFQRLGQASQCGGCSQCIDRRFAAYATNLHDTDESGLYALDFLKETIQDLSVRTTLVDYVREAKHFADWNIDHFQTKLLSELTDVVGYVGLDDQQSVEKVFNLCKHHADQIAAAIRKMCELREHPFRQVPEGSFLKIVGDREYLSEPKFDYEKLAAAFDSLPAGNEHAGQYEKAVKDALLAIFEPDLANPKFQQRVDQGRMRIDIAFDNKAKNGFFANLRDSHKKRCAWVFFECKSYTEELGNPDFAQLLDRMQRMGTEVGFVICRSVGDGKAALKHCQDRSSSLDGGNVVMVLDDSDLKHLLRLRGKGSDSEVTTYLEEKMRQVLFKP